MHIKEAAIKMGITRYQLRYWIRIDLLHPLDGVFSFADLKKIQFLKQCHEHNIHTSHLKECIQSLSLLHPDKAWYSELIVYNGHLIIKENKVFIEPNTSQLVFDYINKDHNSSINTADAVNKSKVVSFSRQKDNGWSTDRNLASKEELYLASLTGDDDILQEKLLKDILSEKPDHKGALIEMGNLKFDQDDFNQALDFYDRAFKQDPSCVEAVYNMANIYFRQKKHAAAIRCFEKSLEIDPDFPESYYNLGILYFSLEYYDMAEFFLTTYTLMDPDSEWSLQAEDFLDTIRSRNTDKTENPAVLSLYQPF